MNIRDRVHFISQDSLCLNSLAVSRLNHNELKRVSTHCRLAINNGVSHRFLLGCQQPDCSQGRGRAGPGKNSNCFGKRVVEGVHFHHLRVDEVPLPAEDSKPRTIEVGLKSKRSGAVSVDRY